MLLTRCGSVCVRLGLKSHCKKDDTKRIGVHGGNKSIPIPCGRRRHVRNLALVSAEGPSPPLEWKRRAAAATEGACAVCNGASSELGSAAKDGEADEAAEVAPLVDALRECAEMDAAAFHFPGHRRGVGAPPLMAALIGRGAFAADLPELPELDNLHAAEGVIQDAEREAARLFGAQRTWFLVNGSTCGIQAAVMASCAPGEYLVLPRNAHMSTVSGMVLSGALPKYMTPTPDATWGVAHGVGAAQVDAAVREVQSAGGRVGAVLVVSPTYFGVCSRVEEIVRVCHRHGVQLIVDEAHGAHFRFHRELPQTALEQGADVAVQSTHKVLGSLTQSAMLHTQGVRVDVERVAQCLQMLQSSSPSYLLLASLDAARAHMGSNNRQADSDAGTAIMDAPLFLARRVRTALRQIPGLAILDMATLDEQALAGASIGGTDPLRITVGLWGLGLTGFEADDILRLEFGVVAELPSLRSITFAVSVGSSRRDGQRLIDSLTALAARYAHNRGDTAGATACSPSSSSSFKEAQGARGDQVRALSPREAFYAKSERVDVGDAVGRVSAELLCPYPPGIPVVAPGEVLTQAAVDYILAVLAQGGVVTGASDSSFATAKVICSSAGGSIP